MTKKIFDLRGLSCPQPVFETKKAIEDPAFTEAVILVDTQTSVENIARLLGTREDIRYTVKEEGADYAINLVKT